MGYASFGLLVPQIQLRHYFFRKCQILTAPVLILDEEKMLTSIFIFTPPFGASKGFIKAIFNTTFSSARVGKG